MREHIDAVISGLTNLRDVHAGLEDTKVELAQRHAELTDVKAQLDAAKEESKSVTAGLSSAQIRNQRAYEDSIFVKRKEHEAILAKIAAAQGQLSDLEAKIVTATTTHKGIEDSIAAMKKRFA